MSPAIETRIATLSDLPALLELMRTASEDRGPIKPFDAQHAERHLRDKLLNGTTFVIDLDDKLVGAIMLTRIDLGYAYAEREMEALHTFVAPEARRLSVTGRLFRAVEHFADERRIDIIFHETDYEAAIRGEESRGEDVEQLYKFRGYVKVGVSLTRYKEVGRSFLCAAGGRRRKRCA